MSKSYGNYIGITEAPKEIYGKLMSISDQLMWRYYELLTDVTTAEIEAMQRKAAAGEANPMQYKKELAQRIAADFHGADAGKHAAEDWAKQFQQHEIPVELEEIEVNFDSIGGVVRDQSEPPVKGLGWPIRVDKLIARAGLVGSV